MRITCISDTHGYHHLLEGDLPGGDILLHAGDISSRGSIAAIQEFCKWFDSINSYDHKIFIAGNHDWGFQRNEDEVSQIINSYKWFTYLQDSGVSVGDDIDNLVKIWGSPWQPYFLNWAFNLPRNGVELEEKWNLIPADADILLIHCPANGYVDKVIGKYENIGCEKLISRIEVIKPKIHICGHIHTGYGYATNGITHFINASVLDERYQYTQKPITFDWDKETNEIKFI